MADNQIDARETQEVELAEEIAVEQKSISFIGDDLIATRTTTGGIYIEFPAVCNALGVASREQVRRVKRTSVLAKGLCRIRLQTKGGLQMVNCLRVDLLALWLAGVHTDKTKPELREKIETYQENLAPVATQVFLQTLNISTSQIVPTTNEQAIFIAEEIDELTQVTRILSEHLQEVLLTTNQVGNISTQLNQAVNMLQRLVEKQATIADVQDKTNELVAKIDERTKKLTPTQQRYVKEAIDHIALITKDLPNPTAHYTVYNRLKKHFRVTKYDEIDSERFEEVKIFLDREFHKAIGDDPNIPHQGSLF